MLFHPVYQRDLVDPTVLAWYASSRTYWDWAFVTIMMLVMAPQISQDYMVLTLGAFSFVLAGCLLYGDRRAWIDFAIATLLVGNIVPRDPFSQMMLIDHWSRWSGYEHLLRAEAYQYYGFPLLGLLLLTRAWHRLAHPAHPTTRVTRSGADDSV